MRIPSFYQNPDWQRFLAGVAIGAIVSWVIFLFVNGVWQEEHSKLIQKQQEDIKNLQDNIKLWQEEFKAHNKRNKQSLTVQDIKVKIVNGEKYKLDLLSIYEVEEAVLHDLNPLVAKDLETAYKSKELLIRTIENKTITINSKRYRLTVKEMILYTTLSLKLEMQLDG